MIEAKCLCGGVFSISESAIAEPISCAACATVLRFAAGESLPEGAGAADFDARLVIVGGPERMGEHILLGGVAEITVGKLPDKHIMLAGDRLVSRLHCKLNRLDFGPSRWELLDNQSTNGLFVNDERVEAQELRHGDVIRVGEYKLAYKSDAHEAADAVGEMEEPEVDQGGRRARAGAAGVATLTAPAPRAAALSYESPELTERPLGDADINWVMKLRNASVLMVWVINFNFLSSFFLPNIQLLKVGAAVVISLMSFAAAWLLTEPEPNAAERSFWRIIRIALRIFACVTVCAELLTLAASYVENGQLLLIGAVAMLAMVPQTALFLLYLRKLALRLPNRGLALNALLVMIGLPALLAITLGAALIAMYTSKPGLAILTGVGGLIGLLVFRIWYLILLIWFNRSFS